MAYHSKEAVIAIILITVVGIIVGCTFNSVINVTHDNRGATIEKKAETNAIKIKNIKKEEPPQSSQNKEL